MYTHGGRCYLPPKSGLRLSSLRRPARENHETVSLLRRADPGPVAALVELLLLRIIFEMILVLFSVRKHVADVELLLRAKAQPPQDERHW
jgi:hypothetical protein